MNRIIASLLAITAFSTLIPAQNVKTRVSIMTSKGEIVVELDSAKAPKTVRNFLDYVNSGFYDGTIFHRVIKGFMIQGGGFTPDMNKKKTKEPIQNEANNRVSNRRGAIAMARTGDPHSATAQFFINTVDNGARGLDFKSESEGGWGYCVFGKVVKGMPVVDAIEGVRTSSNGMMGDVPVTPILIKKVSVAKETPTPAAAEKK
ncbi:MAG: peptidyl-prolyl cis-trans isomerase [Chitinispirillaceae bacterium]|nr:peptidyl-prolyl cis-trans isomerase [Chitinispirillaceae bacterium]